MKIRFVGFFLIFCVVISCCSCGFKGHVYYIFSDISECDKIDEQKQENAEITLLETSTDKYLKDLCYIDSFACDYSSSELKFTIYAYEFSSNEDAMQYFENTTGKSNQPDTSYSASKGMFNFKLEVVDGNKAYRVTSPLKYDEELLSFLATVFSIEIASRK